MKRSIALLALLGCSGAPKPSPITNAAPPASPVMIALGDSDRVRVVAVTPAKTTTLRDVKVPSYLVELQWVLPDPIVLLGRPNPTAAGCRRSSTRRTRSTPRPSARAT